MGPPLPRADRLPPLPLHGYNLRHSLHALRSLSHRLPDRSRLERGHGRPRIPGYPGRYPHRRSLHVPYLLPVQEEITRQCTPAPRTGGPSPRQFRRLHRPPSWTILVRMDSRPANTLDGSHRSKHTLRLRHGSCLPPCFQLPYRLIHYLRSIGLDCKPHPPIHIRHRLPPLHNIYVS